MFCQDSKKFSFIHFPGIWAHHDPLKYQMQGTAQMTLEGKGTLAFIVKTRFNKTL